MVKKVSRLCVERIKVLSKLFFHLFYLLPNFLIKLFSKITIIWKQEFINTTNLQPKLQFLAIKNLTEMFCVLLKCGCLR